MLTMGGQSINITYETLFDLFRNERKEELQQLPATFYEDFVAYLKEKSSEGDNVKQLQNIHKLVRDIYEMRERKIVNLAIVAARGSQVSTQGLLKPELELFDQVLTLLKGSRGEVLARLLRGEVPGSDLGGTPAAEKQEEKPEGQKETVLVQFILHVPKFVGTELEIYGPFEPGDMATLPTEIAQVLIEKKRAASLG